MFAILVVGARIGASPIEVRWMVAGAIVFALLSLLVLRLATSRARREKRRELVVAWRAGAGQRPEREPPQA